MKKRNRTLRWPVLKHYDGERLDRIAMPLGGIGTGTISLGGRGDLRDWELMNRPAKGFTPTLSLGSGDVGPFFALHVKAKGGEGLTRALEGPVPVEYYEGGSGATVPNHGLPRFRDCRFAAAYPLGQVHLSDPAAPIDVRIEAFNPMIPGNVEASGLPVAVLRFVLNNRMAVPVAATVCGSIPNFVGVDPIEVQATGASPLTSSGGRRARNRFRKGKGVQGILYDAPTVDPDSEAHGTLALVTTAQDGVSRRLSWIEGRANVALLDFWDDLSADGSLEHRCGTGQDFPIGSLAVRLRVPAMAERAITFLITWHFPNRYAWAPKPNTAACSGRTECGTVAAPGETGVGNWYCGQYRDAWDAAVKIAPRLAGLERVTIQFVEAFCSADLPEVVKEAALFNASTLRTETCFRTGDGRFFAWEGCWDSQGCCEGACTHVWNYEHATAHLFAELSRSLRETEFLHATDDAGKMAFRVQLPLPEMQIEGAAAADGQMGCLLKLYRDWRLSGDDHWLRTLWPQARRAIEFCWVKGGWDADRDGVMEGCQHNTMDVEYFGPNPQMTGWYLAALRAGEELATHLGDDEFAQSCRDLFELGSRWMDENLFNGDYYEHQVRPVRSHADIRSNLQVGMGPRKLKDPEFQLGLGCLVDQLVGQFTSHVCGLGYLHKRSHIRRTLKSIEKFNRRSNFHGHFNHMRSYVLGDETALLMASYPRGGRPQFPFPYFSEVMTGFEYTAAVGMLYEGLIKEGLKAISAIRSRYDGKKRNPFDEAECGHHYGRAMASWAAVLALTGFQYDAGAGAITFAASEEAVNWFWSTGDSWGTIRQRPSTTGVSVELRVLFGRPNLKTITLLGAAAAPLRRVTASKRKASGRVYRATIKTKIV